MSGPDVTGTPFIILKFTVAFFPHSHIVFISSILSASYIKAREPSKNLILKFVLSP